MPWAPAPCPLAPTPLPACCCHHSRWPVLLTGVCAPGNLAQEEAQLGYVVLDETNHLELAEGQQLLARVYDLTLWAQGGISAWQCPHPSFTASHVVRNTRQHPLSGVAGTSTSVLLAKTCPCHVLGWGGVLGSVGSDLGLDLNDTLWPTKGQSWA